MFVTVFGSWKFKDNLIFSSNEEEKWTMIGILIIYRLKYLPDFNLEWIDKVYNGFKKNTWNNKFWTSYSLIQAFYIQGIIFLLKKSLLQKIS